MKNFLLLLFATFSMSYISLGQKSVRLIDNESLSSGKLSFNDFKLLARDTALVVPDELNADCASPIIWETNAGFVMGTNEFNDFEKGQRITVPSSDDTRVLGITAFFDEPTIAGDGELVAKIYRVGQDGGPSDLIATSLPLKTSEVNPPDADGIIQPTVFLYEESVSVNDEVEIHIFIDFSALYDSGDQIGLFATAGDCGTSGVAWEIWGDGTVIAISDAWNAPSDWTIFMGALIETNTTEACDAVGGSLSGGPFTFCVGDGIADHVNVADITLEGNSGTNSAWVATDNDLNILGVQDDLANLDFDGAGSGTCLLWNLSYENDLTGAEIGMNAGNLAGCFSLSDSIVITRVISDGGTLEGGPFTFCVGDGEADMIGSEEVSLSGNSGSNSGWVVTDTNLQILAIVGDFSAINFDSSGAGVCLLWHISFEDNLSGVEVGSNATDLGGCFDLSNSVRIERFTGDACPSDCQVDGGEITGGPFTFCVADDISDLIGADEFSLSGESGEITAWVATDAALNIVTIAAELTDIDFDGAGAGICLIWHLAYEGEILGVEIGANTANLEGCFDLSNSITVNRNETEPAALLGGPFTFCVGDSIADILDEDAITVSGGSGSNTQWIVTDANTFILALPDHYSEVNFDDSDEGTCLIWLLHYEGDVAGVNVGDNISNLEGCFDISTPVEVNRVTGDNCPKDCEDVQIAIDTIICNGDEYVLGDLSLTMSGAYSDTVRLENGCDSITTLSLLVIEISNTTIDETICASGVYNFGTRELSEAGTYVDTLISSQGCDSIVTLNLEFEDAKENNIQEEICSGDTVIVGAFVLTEAGTYIDTSTSSSGCDSITTVDLTVLESVMTTVQDSACDGDTYLIGDTGFSVPGEYELTFSGSNGCDSIVTLILTISTDDSCTAECNVDGGTLEGGPFTFTVGQGEAVRIPTDAITLDSIVGDSSQWVITDDEGNILGLPDHYTDVDFDGTGAGTSLVSHLSFDGELFGLEVGANTSNLDGCFALSNAIEVIRTSEVVCEAEGGTLEGGPFTFCVADGEADMIGENDITLSDVSGTNSIWLITDSAGMILGLVSSFTELDFNDVEVGTCLLWHLSYEDDLTGAETGSNAADLGGCFSLSNSIEVIRVSGDDCPTTCEDITVEINESICNGDTLRVGGFTITEVGQYIDTTSTAEVCDSITIINVTIGESCPMECTVQGGEIIGGPFTFCSGDGEADNIMEGAITLTGGSGSNSSYIITDTSMNILGVVDSYEDVNFDAAGPGTCYVWHISYEDDLEGTTVGSQVSDLSGCFDLSNLIEVVRVSGEDCPNACEASSSELEGGPFTFCVADGVADMIGEDEIAIATGSGTSMAWLITNEQGIILTKPESFADIDFDGAGEGICRIWHLTYDGEITGDSVGDNAANIEGCFALSNSIEVVRFQGEDCPGFCESTGSSIEGGPFTFCVADGVADMIGEDEIAIATGSGTSMAWLITNEEGIILTKPGSFADIDFDGAGEGLCRIWHLTYDGDLTGASVGDNAADIEGCFALSNSIEVERLQGSDCPEFCEVAGGTLEGGPFEYCVGDGVADNIPDDGISLAGNMGEGSQWVVTDENGVILGLPLSFGNVDFDGAGIGTCLIWHLSFDGDLTGAEVGENTSDIAGCHDLSNAIEVVRVEGKDCPSGGEDCVEGGSIETASGVSVISFCVGDGRPDPMDVVVDGATGPNRAWVVTDEDLNILAIQSGSRFDFENAGFGTCLIWHLSYEDGLTGAELGGNAANLSGCYGLSNPLTVNRVDCTNSCHAPFQVYVIKNGPRRLTVRWSRVTAAIGYQILVGYDDNPSSFTAFPVGSRRVQLSYEEGRTLVIQVRAICAGGGVSDFTTPIAYGGTSEAKGNALKTGAFEEIKIIDANISISPNPASDYLFVQGISIDSNVEYSIISSDGRTVQSGESFDSQINIEGLNSGIYMLMIVSEKDMISSQRFVKI